MTDTMASGDGKININMKMKGCGCCCGKGSGGKNAYDLAVEAGFEGTVEEWIASLKGETGPQGPKGETGPQGPGGLSDAPSDGKVYGRMNGAWVEISSSGGSGGGTGGDGPTPATDPDLFTAAAFTTPGLHTWTVPNVEGIFVTMCGAGGHQLYNYTPPNQEAYYLPGGGAEAKFRRYVEVPSSVRGTRVNIQVGNPDGAQALRRSYIQDLITCMEGGDAMEVPPNGSFSMDPGAAGGDGGYPGVRHPNYLNVAGYRGGTILQAQDVYIADIHIYNNCFYGVGGYGNPEDTTTYPPTQPGQGVVLIEYLKG